MSFKRHSRLSPIYDVVLTVAMFIYRSGDEGRLVHNLEARGYSDFQIEHPNQYHDYCGRDSTHYFYPARLPNGTPVHGGACISLFIIDTTEPIGKK